VGNARSGMSSSFPLRSFSAKSEYWGTPVCSTGHRPQYTRLTARPAVDVVLRTDVPGNILRVGERTRIVVENRDHREVFIELVGTSSDGLKVILTTPGERVAARGTYELPIVVQPGKGREEVTLLAAAAPLPPGRLLRGRSVVDNSARGPGVIDRVVHDFYRLELSEGRARIAADPATLGLVKRTLVLETK
jgi:hypothetical protein